MHIGTKMKINLKNRHTSSIFLAGNIYDNVYSRNLWIIRNFRRTRFIIIFISVTIRPTFA